MGSESLVVVISNSMAWLKSTPPGSSQLNASVNTVMSVCFAYMRTTMGMSMM